ncbi:unnamed protein product, partial [Urochloa humidicola]
RWAYPVQMGLAIEARALGCGDSFLFFFGETVRGSTQAGTQGKGKAGGSHAWARGLDGQLSLPSLLLSSPFHLISSSLQMREARWQARQCARGGAREARAWAAWTWRRAGGAGAGGQAGCTDTAVRGRRWRGSDGGRAHWLRGQREAGGRVGGASSAVAGNQWGAAVGRPPGAREARSGAQPACASPGGPYSGS